MLCSTEYIQYCLINNEKLSLGIIKEIHRLLLDHLDHNRENFKNIQMLLLEQNETATPEQTPLMMYQ